MLTRWYWYFPGHKGAKCTGLESKFSVTHPIAAVLAQGTRFPDHASDQGVPDQCYPGTKDENERSEQRNTTSRGQAVIEIKYEKWKD